MYTLEVRVSNIPLAQQNAVFSLFSVELNVSQGLNTVFSKQNNGWKEPVQLQKQEPLWPLYREQNFVVVVNVKTDICFGMYGDYGQHLVVC